MITVDSLRADHCGFMGYEKETTPNLDRLASTGLIFENAIAPGPRTPSSVPATFTGEFLPVEKIETEGYGSDWLSKRDLMSAHLERHRPIQRRLDAMGYSRGAVTTNPWTTSLSNFDGGFDVFNDALTENGVAEKTELLDDMLGKFVDSDGWLLKWTDLYEDILETREELDEPYFLWVFLLDPHEPYIVPRQYRTEISTLRMYYTLGMYYGPFRYRLPWLREGPWDPLPDHIHTGLEKTYRDAIRSTDAFVGQLLDDLRGDDPVTVLHADHGEAFYEHGTYGHLSQLYEENVHVPLLVHNTGVSGRIADPVSLRKLPNILESIARGDDDLNESQDFVVTKTGFTRGDETSKAAVRGRRWKLIVNDDDEELYDLETDPGEGTDLADERPEVVDGLRRILERHRAHEREIETITTAVDELLAEG